MRHYKSIQPSWWVESQQFLDVVAGTNKIPVEKYCIDARAAKPTMEDLTSAWPKRRNVAKVESSLVELGGTSELTKSERVAYITLLCSTDVETVFEFGVGEPSLIAALCNVPQLISVDGDKAKIDAVSSNTIWRSTTTNHSSRHIDMGPLGEWGYPLDLSHPGIKHYQQALSLSPFKPDVVLVDGRFRVACALSLLGFITRDTLVVVHDYTSSRGYSMIERYFELIAQTQTLGVFRRREHVNMTMLVEALGVFDGIPQ